MNGSFTVGGAEFAAAVKYVARWIPSKPVVPAHGGILARVDDKRLHLAGYNDTTTGRATLDLVHSDAAEGTFLVSGRLLAELAGTLDNKPVTFEQSGATLDIASGRFRGGMPVMTEDDYPALPELAPELGTVSGTDLAAVVRLTAVAAGRDITIPGLLGLFLEFDFDAGTFTASGSDKVRVAQARGTIEHGSYAADSAYVPAAVLADAMEAFAGADEVTLGLGAGTFSLSTPERALTTTLRDQGAHPGPFVYSVIDVARDTAVTFRAKDALHTLKRIDLLKNATTQGITMTVRSGCVELAAEGGEAVGNGNDEIDAEYDGPEASITAKSPYLNAALASAPGDTVTMSFMSTNFTPILFTSDADTTWRHVIVPLRPLGGTK